MCQTRLTGKCFSYSLPRATECHIHRKRAFRISRHFLQIKKTAGLTGDQTENKRDNSGRLELLVTVLLVLAARTRLSAIVTKDTSHFSPFLHIVTHFVVSQALFPSSCCLFAVTCCRRLLNLLLCLALRKPGARSLGFGGHPGEGFEKSVPWPVWSLFGVQICLVSTWQNSQLV